MTRYHELLYGINRSRNYSCPFTSNNSYNRYNLEAKGGFKQNMDFVAAFQYYLFSRKTPPSDLTVKNYAADIRRFVRWYEKRFKQDFHPGKITHQMLSEFRREQTEASDAYAADFTPASLKSVERYMSSLRKFFHFLTADGIISTNPFDLLNEEKLTKKAIDPWQLNRFKDFLYIAKSSDLTIKNYIMDLQQFFAWITAVSPKNAPYEVKQPDLRTQITPLLLEEYKHRLLNEVKLSPISVNRKLSSLRRYVLWAQSQEIIKPFATKLLPTNVNDSAKEKTTNTNSTEKNTLVLSETAPGSVFPEAQEKSLTVDMKPSKDYSGFPPLRLLQKVTRASLLVFDNLIVLPVSVGLETIGYAIWKAKGSPVFIDPQATFNKKITNLLIRSGLLMKLPKKSPKLIASLPKSFYAPLAVSMQHAPLHQKAIYHLRYTRPEWYKKYHSYAISHYIHAGILILCMSAAGFGIVQTVVGSSKNQLALASVPDGPPRVLSFKGKLTRADGSPITANTNLRFGIYNDSTATGSAMLWEEVQGVIPEADGTFQTLLGKTTHIPSHLFTDNARLYIGMTVENNSELTPRKQIPTAVLAATSDTVQGLRPITDPQSGQKNALLALDSSGNLAIGGNANPVFIATGGRFTIAGQTVLLTTAPGSNSDVQIVPDGLGRLDIQRPLHNTSDSSNLPGVSGAVDIDDSVAINASQSGQSALYINQNSNGPLISASVSGIAKFTLENTGAATFGDNVMINGSALSTSQTSFNLLTTNPINLNIGTSATAISLGATGGVTTINNSQTIISGNLTVNGVSGVTFGNTNAGVTFSGNGNHLISATSGSLQLGTVTLTGNTTVNQDVSIIPAGTDGENNLGSSSNPFDNLYVNTIISPSLINNNLWQTQNGVHAPSQVTNSILIGSTASASAVWQAFGSGPHAGTASSSGNLSFSTTGGDVKITKLNGGGISFQLSSGGDAGAVEVGRVNSTGFLSVSSRRFKSNIAAINDPLGTIGRLQGVSYTWDQAHGGKQDIGFIAEEVGNVLPEVVEWEDDGIHAKGINYGHLTALAIEGIKAQQQQIYHLEEMVNSFGFIKDREYHIVRSSDGTLVVRTNEDEPVNYTGAFAKAFIATLETGLAVFHEVRTQTLVATTSILGNASAQRLHADYIDASDIVATGTLRAGQGIVLLLRTDMIESTEDGATLSLGVGKTSLSVYGIVGGQKQEVATIDDQGNTRFAGNLVASDGNFNGLLTAHEGEITETLKAKKLVAEELELTNEGYVKLLAHLVVADSTQPDHQSPSESINIPTNVSNTRVSEGSESAELTEMMGPPASESAMEASSPLNPPLDPALTTEYADLASSSAALSVLPTTSSYTTYNTASNSALLTTGPLPSGAGVVLPDLSVAGMVTIAGNFILNDGAIDVVGADLQIQPLKSGGVSFMAGLVTIDTNGNLTVNGNANFAHDVTIRGNLAAHIISPIDQDDLIVKFGSETEDKKPALVIQDASGEAKLKIKSSGDVETAGDGSFTGILSRSLSIMRGEQADASPIRTIASSSAGTAIILPGQTQRTVITPFVRSGSLIYLTPTSDTQGVIPYVSRQTEEKPEKESVGSFTIEINKTVTKEIKVNWWIVN